MDRLNLQDPKNESVQTYRDLLKNSKTSPWEAILITDFNSNNIKITYIVLSTKQGQALIFSRLDLYLNPVYFYSGRCTR